MVLNGVANQGSVKSAPADPGVTDTSIIIGSFVNPTGSLAGMSQSLKSVTLDYFDDVNSRGGINGRRVEVKFVEGGATAKSTLASVEKFIQEEHVFAMSAPLLAGVERELFPLFERQRVTVVGPMTLYPELGGPNRQMFYLTSGIAIQARAFVEFAKRTEALKTLNIGIVHRNVEHEVKTVDALREELNKGRMNPLQPFQFEKLDVVESVKQLRAAKRDAVFLLGTADQGLELLNEMARVSWYPHVYLIGGIGAKVFDLPKEFQDKIFLTFPVAPSDVSSSGLVEYRTLEEKYKWSADHKAVRMTALAAAKVLTEGLKRAGRDLTRDKLIQSLETISDFSTGLTPPITFSPTRHIGAQGAHIIKVDLNQRIFVPAGWNSVN
jgi:ABC-type branched-subunit amino acid transport system substrate-binding protein